ncbi:hypothetical protein Syun_029693 [Stephania yunnanensis]|uniref:Reverse transcriptase n=1 Tax=Stephania yunnanensis TaxID=152371 RepID=A0AAP0HHI6_9MAGN
MAFYALPKSTCQELMQVMAKFWWTTSLKERGIHWLKWEKLPMPKNEGRLGFKDLEIFNPSLLAKQC